MPAAGPSAPKPPRTLVAIATTGGPSVIRGFAFDDMARNAEIYLHGQMWEPLKINRAFIPFERSLARELRRRGHDTPPHPVQVALDEDVDGGESWHAGIAAAHLLHAAGHHPLSGL